MGEIALLSIQRDKLVRDQMFDPKPIARVDRLRLTPDGVFGLVAGSWILDRHHRHHPAAERWNADRAISIGFTSHYEHMWGQFRSTPLGSAGENVLVDIDGMVEPGDIGGGVRIDTGDALIEVPRAEVAEPCVGFTRYMTDRPEASAADIDEDRQKLRRGVRGFVLGLQEVEFVEITRGSQVSIRSA